MVIPPVGPVRLGTNVTLTCDVTTTRLINISWTVNGMMATADSSPRFSVTSEPARSTLHISGIVEADLGVVSCNISDPFHFPVSASVDLEENRDLYLIGNVERRVLIVPESSTLVLECPLRSRPEAVLVQWFHGLRLLSNDDDGVSVRSFPNGSEVVTLGVASLAKDDGDEYQCVVSSDRTGTDRILTYDVTIFITSKSVLVILTSLYVELHFPIRMASTYRIYSITNRGFSFFRDFLRPGL